MRRGDAQKVRGDKEEEGKRKKNLMAGTKQTYYHCQYGQVLVGPERT